MSTTRKDRIAVGIIVAVAFPLVLWVSTRTFGDEEPTLIHVKDECRVYTFKYAGNRHFFVNCPKDGRSATTYKVDGFGAHIVTEQR